MNKKICIATSACLLSFLLFLFSINKEMQENEITLNDIESTTQTENGKVIYCRCSKALIFANKDCLASNSGHICAQSDAGGNISCNTYSSNCGKED